VVRGVKFKVRIEAGDDKKKMLPNSSRAFSALRDVAEWLGFDPPDVDQGYFKALRRERGDIFMRARY